MVGPIQGGTGGTGGVGGTGGTGGAQGTGGTGGTQQVEDTLVEFTYDDTSISELADVSAITMQGGFQAYLKLIFTVTNNHEILLEEIERHDLLASRNFFKALTAEFSQLNELYREQEAKFKSATFGSDTLDPLVDTINQRGAELESASEAYANYNGNDSQVESDLRDAAELALTQYDAAVSAYNIEVDDVNDAIEAENVNRVANGQEPIPLKEHLSPADYNVPNNPNAPAPDPYEHSTVPTTGGLSLQDDFLQEYNQQLQNLGLQANQAGEFLLSLGGEEVPIRLPGQSITLPEGFTVQQPVVNVEASVGGAGGVGLASSVTGLDTASAERVISTGLVEDILKDYNLVLNPTFLNSFRDLVVLGAQKIANGSPDISNEFLLGNGLSNSDDSSLRLGQSLGVSNRVLSLIQGNGLENEIKELVNTIPGAENLSAADKQKLIAALTSASTAALLRLTIGSFFTELGVGSVNNVFSNALFLGGSENATKNVSAQNAQFRGIIEQVGRENVAALLAQFLASGLERQGLSVERAGRSAREVADEVLDNADILANLKKLKELLARILLSGGTGDVNIDSVARDLVGFQGASVAREEISSALINTVGGRGASNVLDEVLQTIFGVSPNFSLGEAVSSLRTDRTSLQSSLSEHLGRIGDQEEGRIAERTSKEFDDSRKVVTELGEFLTTMLDPGVAITKLLGPMFEGARGGIDRKRPTDVAI